MRNLRFKLDWASVIVGSKFTIFSLSYVVFEGNFPSTSPWGAYTWRGLFSEFYGIRHHENSPPICSLPNLEYSLCSKRNTENMCYHGLGVQDIFL